MSGVEEKPAVPPQPAPQPWRKPAPEPPVFVGSDELAEDESGGDAEDESEGDADGDG